MKAFETVLKILTALATVAGAIYLLATYGEKIVEWAKKVCKTVPTEEAAPETAEPAPAAEEAPATEEAPAAETPAEEAPAEAPAEEPAPEVVAAPSEPVAEESDFAE